MKVLLEGGLDLSYFDVFMSINKKMVRQILPVANIGNNG